MRLTVFVVVLLCISPLAFSKGIHEEKGLSHTAGELRLAQEDAKDAKDAIIKLTEEKLENKIAISEKDAKIMALNDKLSQKEAAFADLRTASTATKVAITKHFSRTRVQLCSTSGKCDEDHTENLGAQWFTNGPGENHTNGTGENYTNVACADASNCNPAKCHGNTQDNTLLYGDLDCETDPNPKYSLSKGSDCLDNLSGGRFYKSNGRGAGGCTSFAAESAFLRKTNLVTNASHIRDGVITKLLTAHPHNTKKKYGIIAAKRMTCTGSTCHVFKTGLCIKCPRNVFADEKEQHATMKDISKFVNCCVMGRAEYKNGENMADCHEDFQHADGTGAFTAFNHANATLKTEYNCWDGTDDDADGKEAEEAAAALMKAA